MADDQQQEKSASGDGNNKKIKITQMNLDQVTAAIVDCEKKMGGFQSRYAKSLLARQAYLNKSAAS